MPRQARRRGNAQRGADAVMGFLIPIAFIALAGYQQATEGQIDKYVIGALLIFGLGALGWRLDILFEAYMRARYAGLTPTSGSDSVKESDNNGEQ